MKFLLDESADGRLGTYLRSLGHDVTTVAADHEQSLDDSLVLEIAHDAQRILLTDDRDFGMLVNVLHQSHSGVIYFRLGTNVDLQTKIHRLDLVLTQYPDELRRFITVTLDRVRIS